MPILVPFYALTNRARRAGSALELPGWPQHFLENMYIDQSIELTSDFFERSYMKETHAGIEMQTFFAALGHSRDESMKS